MYLERVAASREREGHKGEGASWLFVEL